MYSLKRWIISLLLAILCGMASWSPTRAAPMSAKDGVRSWQATEADPSDRASGSEDWAQCWMEQTGLSSGAAGAAVASLASDTLVTGLEFRLPQGLARTLLHVPGGPRVSLDALTDGLVPLLRTSVLADLLIDGEPLRVVNGSGACLPYPIRSIFLTPMPLIRGRTAALMIETDRLAFCRAAYLGQTETCYRDDASHLVVLVAVSALAEPGLYPLEIELVTGRQEIAFSVPLEIAAGRYGFQYIDPPPALYGLMDAELMASEEAYLARWRIRRSAERRWELPLKPPLAQPPSISADFGDRRSYGGMVSGYHSGIDYRAWTGLPVVSPADGVVIMAERLETRGNALLIDHGWGLVTGFWHLSRFDVQVGDVVARGQKVGEVGNTGLSTGSHLHWETWVNGVSVDGRQWLDVHGLSDLGLKPYQSPVDLEQSVPQ